MSRRVVAASVGPGWAEQGGTAHLLLTFPPASAKRWQVWCGSIRTWGRVTTVWSFLHQPENPCLDCDRARQVGRVQAIARRLR